MAQKVKVWTPQCEELYTSIRSEVRRVLESFDGGAKIPAALVVDVANVLSTISAELIAVLESNGAVVRRNETEEPQTPKKSSGIPDILEIPALEDPNGNG